MVLDGKAPRGLKGNRWRAPRVAGAAADGAKLVGSCRSREMSRTRTWPWLYTLVDT